MFVVNEPPPQIGADVVALLRQAGVERAMTALRRQPIALIAYWPSQCHLPRSPLCWPAKPVWRIPRHGSAGTGLRRHRGVRSDRLDEFRHQLAWHEDGRACNACSASAWTTAASGWSSIARWPTASATSASRWRAAGSMRWRDGWSGTHPVRREPAALADQRCVRGLISFADPGGNRLEAFWGAAAADEPFPPGRPISGFGTGPLGRATPCSM